MISGPLQLIGTGGYDFGQWIYDDIAVGKSEGRLISGGNRVGDKGFFLEPTVIADIDPQARISQEEIFGPVLAIIKANDFDHAMEIANNTEFGLTGSLYTSDEKKIEREASTQAEDEGKRERDGRRGAGANAPRALVHEAIPFLSGLDVPEA